MNCLQFFSKWATQQRQRSNHILNEIFTLMGLNLYWKGLFFESKEYDWFFSLTRGNFLITTYLWLLKIFVVLPLYFFININYLCFPFEIWSLIKSTLGDTINCLQEVFENYLMFPELWHFNFFYFHVIHSFWSIWIQVYSIY